MGLLDAFKQYINDALPGGLLNPEAAQLPGLMNAQASATAQAIKAKGQSFKRGLDDPQKYAGEAFAAGMDMAGMAPLGLTVWHGSPHKFNKFDMSKIGTGEGAQAYGHGLYFAEAPAVAQEYAKMTGSGPEGTARMLLNMYKDRKVAKEVAEAGIKPYLTPEAKAHQQKVVELLAGDTPINGSQLYKVDIPDEAVARMLDWDKPLSQQAPEVQRAMAKVIEKKNPRLAQYMQEAAGLDEAGQAAVRKRLGINIFDTIDTGGAAYQAAGQGNVEGLLKSLGVPGIRYLDGGSRSAGQGSSNFVLFDDQLPRILETNGVPTGLLPWQPGEWKGLLK